MRTLISLTLALFVAGAMFVLSPARDASAIASISLVWRESGSSVVTVPSDSVILHLDVILHDTDGLGLLAYDWNVLWSPSITANGSGLGGAVTAPPGWSTASSPTLGANYYGDSTVGTVSPAYYGASFTWVMATITFHVIAPSGTDWAWLGTTLSGQSAAADGPGTITPQFASAKVVHTAPEPGTTALLALGLLGLTLAGRRNR